MSLFEPHTEGIRKGKVVKPTEFEKLVTIQEAEHQIVTAYAVHAERPADQTLWVPALEAHQQIFDRAPDLAAADRGFASAANEQAATARGVRRVILPRPGTQTPGCLYHGLDGTAGWVGLGVIANNLLVMATRAAPP